MKNLKLLLALTIFGLITTIAQATPYYYTFSPTDYTQSWVDIPNGHNPVIAFKYDQDIGHNWWVSAYHMPGGVSTPFYQIVDQGWLYKGAVILEGGGIDILTFQPVADTSPTPVPSAILLLGTGLVGLAGFRRCSLSDGKR